MKNLALFFLIPLAIVGIILAALASISHFENSRNEFENFAEMEAAGLIVRGWLPAYFPKSATRILEGHNLDTNRVWATFRYEKGDIESIGGVCRKITENDVGSKYLCPPYDSGTSIMVLRNDGEAGYISFEDPIRLNFPMSVGEDHRDY